uniref:Uncharacterized protein n=1 Tax=Arundo donax TaxID=35708 RepID=A0A0A8YSH1_ARUDO
MGDIRNLNSSTTVGGGYARMLED